MGPYISQALFEIGLEGAEGFFPDFRMHFIDHSKRTWFMAKSLDDNALVPFEPMR